MRYHALIPAAGGGTRFGAESPKQYTLLEGKPVLLHAIDRLSATLPLHMTYVVLASDDCWFDRVIGMPERVIALRCGGATRAETVRNALVALPDISDDDWIVVHDAARPCIDAASLLRLQRELVDDSTGGLLAIPEADSLKRADQDKRVLRTEPRDGLWRAQTPQVFRYNVLLQAFSQPGIEQMTDEAQVVEAAGGRPRLIMGSPNNVKITYPDDLKLAAAILSAERRASAV